MLSCGLKCSSKCITLSRKNTIKKINYILNGKENKNHLRHIHHTKQTARKLQNVYFVGIQTSVTMYKKSLIISFYTPIFHQTGMYPKLYYN
jgi:hypothetical protein